MDHDKDGRAGHGASDYWFLAQDLPDDGYRLDWPSSASSASSLPAEYSEEVSLWMALCSRAAYSDDKKAKVIFKLAGFAQPTFISAEGTEAYLAHHATAPFTVLAFRGTAGFTDIRTDLRFLPVPVPWHEEGGRAHRGFLKALEPVWEEIKQEIQQGMKQHADHDLYVTGHSLGGALAILAGHRIRACSELPTPKAVYTIGCPRVGNGKFATQVPGMPIYRVVWAGDAVTRMPPWLFGYRHTAPEHWLRPQSIGATRKPGKSRVARLLRWLDLGQPAKDLVVGAKATPKERWIWRLTEYEESFASFLLIAGTGIGGLLLVFYLSRTIPSYFPALDPTTVLLFVLFVVLELFVLDRIAEYLPTRAQRWLRFQRLRDHSSEDYVRELATRATDRPLGGVTSHLIDRMERLERELAELKALDRTTRVEDREKQVGA